MVFADCWYICQWQPSSVSFVVINDFQHTMLVLECLNRAKIDWSHLQWRTNSWGSSCQDCHTPFVPNMEKVRLACYGSEYISLNIYHAGCWKYGLLSRPQLLIWILLIGAQLSSESLYLEISQSVIIIILTIPIITMIRNFFISRCKLTNWQSYSGSLIFCISLPVEETNISGNITQTYYFLRLGVGRAKSALLFFLQHTDPSHYHKRQSTAEKCWFTLCRCLCFGQHGNMKKKKYLANLSKGYLC